LCDYFIHCSVFAREFSIFPWFIYKYDIPVLPIDYWQLGVTPFRIDLFGDQYLEIDRHILDMPCVMHPVPLCYPKHNHDKRACYFPLLVTNKSGSAGSIAIRQKLGLSAQDKVILLSLSKWQEQKYKISHVDKIVEGLPVLISYYLRQLPANVYVLFFGGNKCELLHFPKHRIRHISSIDIDNYESLLASVDLLLTLNLPSTALTRAALLGTKSLVLSNSHCLSNANDIKKLTDSQGVLPSLFVKDWVIQYVPVYPFRMWPMGWYTFIEPLLQDNPFANTFSEVEILNERAVLEGLNTLLFDEETRSKYDESRDLYINQFSKLYSCEEMISKICHEINACS
jgi:hypothetical protein